MAVASASIHPARASPSSPGAWSTSPTLNPPDAAMSRENAATRFVAITALIAAIALSACGGGESSTATTPPPDQTGLDWSRCAGSN